jgi:hypothetical protein
MHYEFSFVRCLQGGFSRLDVLYCRIHEIRIQKCKINETVVMLWVIWTAICLADCLEDPGLDGRILLKVIFKNYDIWVETTFIWLTTATAGGLLSTRIWTFGFHDIQGIFLNSWEPLSFSRRTMFHVLGHLKSRMIVLIYKITRGGLGTFTELFVPTYGHCELSWTCCSACISPTLLLSKLSALSNS